MRDQQRNKVYLAEDASLPQLRKFKTITEAQHRANRVIATKWFRRRYPHVRSVRVTRARGLWALTTGRHIRLPAWGMNEKILLHELAHVAVGARYKHGPAYAATLLAFVSRFMGTARARRLRSAFDRHGVSYKPRSFYIRS